MEQRIAHSQAGSGRRSRKAGLSGVLASKSEMLKKKTIEEAEALHRVQENFPVTGTEAQSPERILKEGRAWWFQDIHTRTPGCRTTLPGVPGAGTPARGRSLHHCLMSWEPAPAALGGTECTDRCAFQQADSYGTLLAEQEKATHRRCCLIHQMCLCRLYCTSWDQTKPQRKA